MDEDNILQNDLYSGFVRFINNDCLEALDEIDNQVVDLVLTDLPYGTTACKWDAVIPFEPMWEQLNRIVKPNTPILFTASQPFTSALVASNFEMFRHEWIYQKTGASNFAQAKYAPMKEHESVLVFSQKKPNYYPIKEERKGSGLARSKYAYSDKSRKAVGEFISVDINEGTYEVDQDAGNDELRYPSSVQLFNNRAKGDRGFHPTQKPVALLEYFIETYSKPGELVLDFTMGSGSTAIAAVETQRDFIGIEKDPEIYQVAQNRFNVYNSVQP